MHKNAFPKNQDAVLFIDQMMIWSPEQNKALMKKAYDSLNPGGTDSNLWLSIRRRREKPTDGRSRYRVLQRSGRRTGRNLPMERLYCAAARSRIQKDKNNTV